MKNRNESKFCEFLCKLKTVFGGKGQIENPREYEQLEKENKLVLSYLTVRKLIGILGFFLPIILLLVPIILSACCYIQPSISNYYHTIMRDVFVGYMCALSIFLLSYKGYDIVDRVLTFLAGIFGLMLALLPTTFKVPMLPCNIECSRFIPDLIGTIHLISAGLFLLSLAFMSLFLFTKGESTPTPQKLIRNKIYRISGLIMLACIGLLIIFFALPETVTTSLLVLKPVFWLETIAIMAFGVSWLVKGEFLMKDS
ncbi:MAG: DUF998 domain-containing protein [Bacteroidia bacterium]|nr:DUF998 domain-containing protein [Bacteroidia bacterium]